MPIQQEAWSGPSWTRRLNPVGSLTISAGLMPTSSLLLTAQCLVPGVVCDRVRRPLCESMPSRTRSGRYRKRRGSTHGGTSNSCRIAAAGEVLARGVRGETQRALWWSVTYAGELSPSTSEPASPSRR